MDSRKRRLNSACENKGTEKFLKKAKEDEKENQCACDDSFEDFFKGNIKKISPKKDSVSPRTRSARLQLPEKDDEDSFDSPVFGSIPALKSQGSGVDGFPSLTNRNAVQYLKITRIDSRDDCLDVECKSSDGNLHTLYLQGRWSETVLEVGDMVNLIGAKPWANEDFIADDDDGLVIVNPDVLVPCTSTASATWCSRKTILNDRFKFGNSANKAMLLGNIMHQIFQTAIVLKKRPIGEKDLLEIWKEQSPKYAEELVALSFTPNCLNTELQPYLSIIYDWINKHTPKSNFFTKKEPLPSKSVISEVFDIEENIWDPILGLKGKIDVTMKTKLGNTSAMESLELKTGKSSFSADHMGQVLLYCMMLSSRYDQPIVPGNLLYLKDGVSRAINPKAPELFSILQQRNKLSKYLDDFSKNLLPEPRSESRFCDKCDQKVICTFFQSKEESFANSSQGMKEFAEQEMAHLQPQHFEYASNWIKWVLSEWKTETDRNQSKIKDIWLKPLEERTADGTCVSNLFVESEEVSNSQRIFLNFTRKSQILGKETLKSGDVAILSSKKQISISFVIVDKVEDSLVRVSSDKSVKTRYEGPFHLDKYSSSNVYSTTLGNIVYCLQNDEVGSRLRSVLIDLQLSAVPNLTELVLPNPVKKIIAKAKLNNEQRLAILHALQTENYVIVEGLPGSGKTTLISVLIQCLVASGKTVLMTAFTHSAVDNILTKVKNEVKSDSILRLGSSSSISQQIQHLSLSAKLENVDSDDYYAKLRKIMKTTPVVACTCHHVPRELLFSYRTFDVVIVDEASMVMEPLLLPVLATSLKFVLVGDCKQLTPLVLSKKAKTEGADISTMQKLQQAHPSVVISLTSQYRMNNVFIPNYRIISMLSSKLFYENRLVCGNEAVSRGSLDRSGDYLVKEGEDKEYFKSSLSGDIMHSCIFIDTQSDMNTKFRCDDAEFGGMSNQGEAESIEQLCTKFLENGIKPSEIGIMSAYRKQVDLMRNVLKRDDVEVNTIDSYQGREKRVIIWSMTWTSNSEKKSELLRDEKRVNVALTRCRQKLVLVGCKKSLETIPVIYRLLDLVENHEKITMDI